MVREVILLTLHSYIFIRFTQIAANLADRSILEFTLRQFL